MFGKLFGAAWALPGWLQLALATPVLFWLGDTGPDAASTWSFLDRRIADVMRFEKTKAQLNENPLVRAVMWGPMQVLSAVRAPGQPGKDRQPPG